MLTINEFSQMNFCLPNQTYVCPIIGQSVLEEKNIAYETTWDVWQNFLALTMISILFLILSGIQLFRMKKTK